MRGPPVQRGLLTERASHPEKPPDLVGLLSDRSPDLLDILLRESLLCATPPDSPRLREPPVQRDPLTQPPVQRGPLTERAGGSSGHSGAWIKLFEFLW